MPSLGFNGRNLMKRVNSLLSFAALFTFLWAGGAKTQVVETTCSEDARVEGSCASILVRREFGLSSLLQADGAQVCFIENSKAARLLEEFYKLNSLSYSPVVFDSLDALAFNAENGQCDLFAVDTGDVNAVSGLIPNDMYVPLNELSGR